MYSRGLELAVGIFICLGLAAFALLALQVSGLSLGQARPGYTLYAEFTDIGGLRPRGKVSVAGVTIGEVRQITLNPESIKARVEMYIDSEVDYLTFDSIAVISTAGLLGEKYVNISVGGDPDILGDGDFIESTQGALNIEQLIGNFATGQ